jgi:hypothetical protein
LFLFFFSEKKRGRKPKASIEEQPKEVAAEENVGEKPVEEEKVIEERAEGETGEKRVKLDEEPEVNEPANDAQPDAVPSRIEEVQ